MPHVKEPTHGKYFPFARAFWRAIFQALFPVRNSFDFSKTTPEELSKILPKSRGLHGATALTGRQNIYTVLSYRNSTTKALIRNIKYRRDRHAIACAGYILYHALSDNIREAGTARAGRLIIIPMATSRARRRQRGYNQCELMAGAILSHDAGRIFEIRTDILFKKIHTGKQTFKNRNERLASMEGIFETRNLKKNITQNMTSNMTSVTIFVLDDVITTGSTMRSALDCLGLAGFEDVRGISLAH